MRLFTYRQVAELTDHKWLVIVILLDKTDNTSAQNKPPIRRNLHVT
jgi:hypothetical protein